MKRLNVILSIIFGVSFAGLLANRVATSTYSIRDGTSNAILYLGTRLNTGQKQAIFRASSDNGQTFEKPITVSSNSK